MNEEILETVTLACNCGKKVDYPNTQRGAINVGQCQRATGWKSLHDTYTYGCLWVCPECFAQALEHAKAIVETLGTGNVSVKGIISAGK